jgi:hypothetical protein
LEELMSLARLSCLAVAFLSLAVGCGQDSPTNPPAVSLEDSGDLELRWPAVTREDRHPSNVVTSAPSTGPAGVITEEEPPAEPPEDASASIISPITEVGFRPTYAYSRGRHRYVGNIGRVSTEATVTFDGEVLGTQPSERQDATPFLLDWGTIKSISTEAYIFTGHDCGLTVSGSSDHEARWQWFLGGPVPNWGSARMSSQAFPPVSQPPCEQEAQPNGGGGGSGGSGGGSLTCWYWVTYDQFTGEVLDADLLYCEEVGG